MPGYSEHGQHGNQQHHRIWAVRNEEPQAPPPKSECVLRGPGDLCDHSSWELGMMNIFCSCFLSIQPSSDNCAWIFPRNPAFSGASGELTPPLSSGIDNLIQDQLIREFHVLLTTNGGWFSYRYVCDPIRGRVCPGVLLGKLGKKALSFYKHCCRWGCECGCSCWYGCRYRCGCMCCGYENGCRCRYRCEYRCRCECRKLELLGAILTSWREGLP